MSEHITQSFIAKIWLEESVGETGRASWRGHITQVPSGNRQYIETLDDIVQFIAPRLEEMGARVALFWRIKFWLGRWRENRSHGDDESSRVAIEVAPSATGSIGGTERSSIAKGR